MPIDYDAAQTLIERVFAEVEDGMLRQAVPELPAGLPEQIEIVFRSNTQAYREAMLGCAIARYQDRAINIRLPYIKHGSGAYNGRTLDERVVNPFFQHHRIPCSRAPFLSTFRRGIRFDEETKKGIRDLGGYDAFLALVGYLEGTDDDEALLAFLKYLLFRFAQLRESAIIPLTRLHRISLEIWRVDLWSAGYAQRREVPYASRRGCIPDHSGLLWNELESRFSGYKCSRCRCWGWGRRDNFGWSRHSAGSRDYGKAHRPAPNYCHFQHQNSPKGNPRLSVFCSTNGPSRRCPGSGKAILCPGPRSKFPCGARLDHSATLYCGL